MYTLLTRGIALLLLLCSLETVLGQQPIDRYQLMEYLQNQEYDQAISYLQPRVQENNISQLSLLAYTYYLSGKTKDAGAAYEKVLQLDSNNLTARQYLASIAMQMENPLAAIPHYRYITRMQPNNAVACKQLSFACYAIQQFDTAFVWLQKAYHLNSADPKVAARLAEEWLGKENYLQRSSRCLVYP